MLRVFLLIACVVVFACSSPEEPSTSTDVSTMDGKVVEDDIQVFVVKGPPETKPTATVEVAEPGVETRPESEQESQAEENSVVVVVEEKPEEAAYLYRDHYGAAVASIEERIYPFRHNCPGSTGNRC